MGQLRDRMVEDLKLSGYSPATAEVYLHYGKAFSKHFRRSPRWERRSSCCISWKCGG